MDIELRAGEAVALIGANGAGKSTLVSILAGALEPTEGALVNNDPPPVLGWAPQKPALYGRLSARENLELFARLEGVENGEETVSRLLALVQLADGRKAAAELSAGNQQRLNVALALLRDPDILLLDEPTASLDPGQRRRVWDVAAAVKERGGAVVFATQNLEEVERFADRVVALREGRVVFDGAVDDYERAPETDVFA